MVTAAALRHSGGNASSHGGALTPTFLQPLEKKGRGKEMSSSTAGKENRAIQTASMRTANSSEGGVKSSTRTGHAPVLGALATNSSALTVRAKDNGTPAHSANASAHASESTEGKVQPPLRKPAREKDNRAVATEHHLEKFISMGTSLLSSDSGSSDAGRDAAITAHVATAQSETDTLAEHRANSGGNAAGRTSGYVVHNTTAVTSTKQKLKPVSWFALTFSFAFVIKAMCMLSNVFFQVSPLPQVLTFDKQGDTAEADAAPFISILYGGCQWCFYGFFAFVVTGKSGFLVLVYSNVVGACLGVYYIWVFQRNCINKQSLKKLHMYCKIASTMVVMQVCAMIVLPTTRALFFCGLVSSVCSVVGSCSLLSTLPTVLETRCSGSINLPFLVTGFIGAILWSVCGFILWDFLIMGPQLVSICFQCVAFSLILYFPRDLDAVKGSPVVATPAIGRPSRGVTERRSAERGWRFPPSEDEAEERFLLTGGHHVSTGEDSDVEPPRGAQDYGSLGFVGETGGT